MNNKFALHGSIQHARTRGSSHTTQTAKACILWCSTITPRSSNHTHSHSGRWGHEIEPPPSRHAPSPDPALLRELLWWLRRLRRSALPTCAESSGRVRSPHCPGSAHAEYEGLALGLEAAAASGFTSFSLDIEDCRVVLSQAATIALEKAEAALTRKGMPEQMPLNGLPSHGSIPHENEHADALSRAASTRRRRHSGAILATIPATSSLRFSA